MASKYDRIAADIRSSITTGSYPVGKKMPAETELMERYDVSLGTIRRALDVLESEGAIERRHGVGTLVKAQKQRLNRSNLRYQWEKDRVGLSEEERAQRGSTEYETGLERDALHFISDYETISGDAELADLLNIDLRDMILRRTYEVRKRDEKGAIGIIFSYIPVDLVSANPALLDSKNEPWPGGTQHQLSTVGVEFDQIEDHVRSRTATLEESHQLDIRVGTSVLAIRKISYDITGRVVEVADSVWPGDRVQLSFTTALVRWS